MIRLKSPHGILMGWKLLHSCLLFPVLCRPVSLFICMNDKYRISTWSLYASNVQTWINVLEKLSNTLYSTSNKKNWIKQKLRHWVIQAIHSLYNYITYDRKLFRKVWLAFIFLQWVIFFPGVQVSYHFLFFFPSYHQSSLSEIENVYIWSR